MVVANQIDGWGDVGIDNGSGRRGDGRSVLHCIFDGFCLYTVIILGARDTTAVFKDKCTSVFLLYVDGIDDLCWCQRRSRITIDIKFIHFMDLILVYGITETELYRAVVDDPLDEEVKRLCNFGEIDV